MFYILVQNLHDNTKDDEGYRLERWDFGALLLFRFHSTALTTHGDRLGIADSWNAQAQTRATYDLSVRARQATLPKSLQLLLLWRWLLRCLRLSLLFICTCLQLSSSLLPVRRTLTLWGSLELGARIWRLL